MTITPFLVTEEKIARLERIVFALAEGARRLDGFLGKPVEILEDALSAECVRCGTRVKGGELVLLLELPSPKDTNVRIKRMREGKCVHEKCPSTSYRLTVAEHPGIDWRQVLSTRTSDEPEAQTAEELIAGKFTKAEIRQNVRLGIFIFAGLVVLIIRQIYIGGTIPIIREPEKFRVDPAPEFQAAPPR